MDIFDVLAFPSFVVEQLNEDAMRAFVNMGNINPEPVDIELDPSQYEVHDG